MREVYEYIEKYEDYEMEQFVVQYIMERHKRDDLVENITTYVEFILSIRQSRTNIVDEFTASIEDALDGGYEDFIEEFENDMGIDWEEEEDEE